MLLMPVPAVLAAMSQRRLVPITEDPLRFIDSSLDQEISKVSDVEFEWTTFRLIKLDILPPGALAPGPTPYQLND